MTDENNKNQQAEELIAQAIRTRLQSLLDGGVTPRSLMQIERTAAAAQQLLAVGKEPTAIRRGNLIGSAQYMTPGGLGYDIGLPDAEAPSTSAETFGASFMREKVSMASAGRDATPKELIDGLVAAKAAGLESVVNMFESALKRAVGNGEEASR